MMFKLNGIGNKIIYYVNMYYKFCLVAVFSQTEFDTPL